MTNFTTGTLRNRYNVIMDDFRRSDITETFERITNSNELSELKEELNNTRSTLNLVQQQLKTNNNLLSKALLRIESLEKMTSNSENIE